MKKIAILFPGQGSQSVGMGKDLYENNEVASLTMDSIDRLSGRSLSKLCFEGPEEELKRTINTQPTILAVSLAAYKAYEAASAPEPAYLAGHSLGEFTALAAAGVLGLEPVLKLVERRAQLMEDCPNGAMSAVIGAKAENLVRICQDAEAEIGSEFKEKACVIVANFNTHEQLVISGSPEAVQIAGAKAKSEGAKVIPLPVGGAFHSPLMENAATEFAKLLNSLEFGQAKYPVVQNLDAKPASAAQELRDKLSRQMPSAVRWCETIEFMLSQGVDTFVEIGPGKALSGMVKKINRSVQTFNIFDSASLNETCTALKEAALV